MTLAWPSTLPQTFQLSSFEQKLADNVLSAKYEAGPSGRRPRVTQNITAIAGSMFMTTTEWEALETFVADDIRGREYVFAFPAQPIESLGFLLLRDGVSFLLLRDGASHLVLSGVAMWLVLMDQPPSRTWLAEDFWLVTMNLIILPQ